MLSLRQMYGKNLLSMKKNDFKPQTGAKFFEIVDKTWKPNVTMIDPQQDLRLDEVESQASVRENPLNTVKNVRETGLMETPRRCTRLERPRSARSVV